MIEFTKHPGSACHGLEVGCLEVDNVLRCATCVSERLAVGAEVGLVGEEQGLEFGKLFYQWVEVSNSRGRADNLLTVSADFFFLAAYFVSLRTRTSLPRKVLNILISFTPGVRNRV